MTDNETNRRLRQRAHGLHKNLDLSSLERLSLGSLRLEYHGANAETLARTYGVIAVTNYSVSVGSVSKTSRILYIKVVLIEIYNGVINYGVRQ